MIHRKANFIWTVNKAMMMINFSANEYFTSSNQPSRLKKFK